MSGQQDSTKVSKRAEEGLRYRLKKHALEQCRPTLEAYVECSKPRLLSVIWECRGQLKDINACLKPFNDAEAFERLKKRWCNAGQPSDPNWHELLKGIGQRDISEK